MYWSNGGHLAENTTESFNFDGPSSALNTADIKAAWKDGDIVGVLVDMEHGLATFFNNDNPVFQQQFPKGRTLVPVVWTFTYDQSFCIRPRYEKKLGRC